MEAGTAATAAKAARAGTGCTCSEGAAHQPSQPAAEAAAAPPGSAQQQPAMSVPLSHGIEAPTAGTVPDAAQVRAGDSTTDSTAASASPAMMERIRFMVPSVCTESYCARGHYAPPESGVPGGMLDGDQTIRYDGRCTPSRGDPTA